MFSVQKTPFVLCMRMTPTLRIGLVGLIIGNHKLLQKLFIKDFLHNPTAAGDQNRALPSFHVIAFAVNTRRNRRRWSGSILCEEEGERDELLLLRHALDEGLDVPPLLLHGLN
jgi:hypothetical protein